MASPLQYFRRHQGYILAVLGVILIVTWVIGPSLESLFQASKTSGSDLRDRGVVAQWKAGDITRGELTTAGWEHEAVIRFLLDVVARAQEEDAKPQAPFLTINQNQIDFGIPMQTDDPTLVQVMLFAHKGKELGIVVDHKAMMNYLMNLGGFALVEADFHELARKTVSLQRDGTTGAPLVTVTQLFDRLKLELTALQAQSMFSAGLTGYSTGELWEYHEQLHRRHKIEAFPIKVADYRGRFKESDAKEDELRKIYDEGKERIGHPDYAEPGFRQPLKLAFQYVKFDFAKFLDAAKKDVTDEQLQAEYEKEIAAGNFRNLKLDDVPSLGTPGGTEPPQNPDAPAEAKDDAKAPAGEKGAKQDEGEKSKEAQGTKEEPPSEEKSCQDEPAKTEDEAPAAADDAKPVENKAETKPDEAKEKSKPAESNPPATTEPGGEPPADAAKPPEPEVKPLSEVREQLLTRLARPAAEKAQQAAINDIVRAVSDYGVKFTHWTEGKKAGSKVATQDPGELKIGALAARHGVVVGKTPLSDQFAIAQTELGQQAAFRGTQGTVPFADGAFYENRPLYAPRDASSISGETTFIYWRTEHVASELLPYEKARPQVVAAWIHQQAFEAAKKDAAALAEKVTAEGTLKDALTEEQAKQVIEPLPFTWWTRGGSPLAFGGSPTLTEVNGIPLARAEFMESVFELEVGKAGVAVDQPHRTVYVVRAAAHEPSLDIRREMFLSGMQAGMFGDLHSFARLASRDVMGDAIEELRKEYQLKWVETPRYSEM